MRSKILAILLLIVVLAGTSCSSQTIPSVTVAAPPPSVPATQAPAPTEVPPTQPPAQSKSLIVLAAASLTEPFKEIGQMFEAKNPGVKAEFNFAGSQQLAQQLDQGAPADLFASANQKYMDAAVTSKRVNKDNPKTFATNRLMVIFPKNNPAGVKELKDLTKPGLKLDLAAKEVPVGQYSLDFLDKASKDPAFDPNFKESVLKNVVSYEDNVKSVLNKITLGEADAGIVYASDVSVSATDKVGKLDIPDALNTVASYPIGTISDSQNPDLAKDFMDLVLSKEGQDVLAKYSFIPILK